MIELKKNWVVNNTVKQKRHVRVSKKGKKFLAGTKKKKRIPGIKIKKIKLKQFDNLTEDGKIE